MDRLHNGILLVHESRQKRVIENPIELFLHLSYHLDLILGFRDHPIHKLPLKLVLEVILENPTSVQRLKAIFFHTV